jgi:hypothetical protein
MHQLRPRLPPRRASAPLVRSTNTGALGGAGCPFHPLFGRLAHQPSIYLARSIKPITAHTSATFIAAMYE